VNQDISVDSAAVYGLYDLEIEVQFPEGAKDFSPWHPDRLWDPRSLVSSGYREHFSRRKSGRGVKLTAHLRRRMVELHLYFSRSQWLLGLMNRLHPLEHWGRGFESHLRHGCLCVRLFCVCVVLCVGSGLPTGWSPVQGVLPTVYRLRNWKSDEGP
jgi:hypothetical protein